MDSHPERDLRDGLAALAAGLGGDVSARVLAHDYRPRAGVARAALAGAGGAVALATVAALLAAGLGSNAPRAFAGWSPTPTAPAGGQTRRAEQACRSRLASSAIIEHAQQTATGRHAPWPIPRIPDGGWQTTLSDVRGPYTVTLFVAAEGAAEFSCFSGRVPGQVSLGGSFATHPPAPLAAGRIAIVSSGANTTPPDEGSAEFSRLVGRTGAGVRAVTLRLNDGSRVRASLSRGWFLAWWPGNAHVLATEVRT